MGAASEASGPNSQSIGYLTGLGERWTPETVVTLAQVDALRCQFEAGAVSPANVPIQLLAWLWMGSDQAPHFECERQLQAAEHDADQLYYELHNPAAVRAEHQRSLDAVNGRVWRAASERDRTILDAVEAVDVVEARRLCWLKITDESAYRVEIAKHAAVTN